MPRTAGAAPVPTGERCSTCCPGCGRAGRVGPALLPVPADHGTEAAGWHRLWPPAPPGRRPRTTPHDPTALVVATSGSTGTPKGALLPVSALHRVARRGDPHAAHRTGRRIPRAPRRPDLAAGAARPPHRRPAGAAARGRRGHRADRAGHRAAVHRRAFVARGRADARPAARFVSLVPTQLHRILADPEATTALATLRRRAGRRCVDTAGPARRRRGRRASASSPPTG